MSTVPQSSSSRSHVRRSPIVQAPVSQEPVPGAAVSQPSMDDAGRRPAPVASLDVTVLSGGPGDEREVSLASGKAVAEALVTGESLDDIVSAAVDAGIDLVQLAAA